MTKIGWENAHEAAWRRRIEYPGRDMAPPRIPSSLHAWQHQITDIVNALEFESGATRNEASEINDQIYRAIFNAKYSVYEYVAPGFGIYDVTLPEEFVYGSTILFLDKRHQGSWDYEESQLLSTNQWRVIHMYEQMSWDNQLGGMHFRCFYLPWLDEYEEAGLENGP